MSLFKVQDLWSAQCGDGAAGDTFHAHSLTIGMLGEFEHELMIVSNSTGCLKIFCLARDNPADGYLSDDCLLELCLAHPVMQTSIGKFVSGSQITYLATLHPKSISIYNLHVIPGTTQHGNEAQLQHIQDYRLAQFGSFRLLSGSFGLNSFHDCFAVVYLDGSLEFLDQNESVLVSLPDVLLPCPIVYQNLISKKPSISWSLNLGEGGLGLSLVSLSMSSLLVCVGERTLSVVHENGFLVVAKRIQYSTQCFVTYNHPLPHDQDNFMILIVSDTQTMLLYDKHLTLTWSASLLRSPVSVKLYNTLHTTGGDLDLNYLGTEPLLFIPPPPSKQPSSIAHIQHHLKQLQQKIRDLQTSSLDGLESNQHPLDYKAEVDGGQVRIEIGCEKVISFVQASLEPESPYLRLDQSQFISSQPITDAPLRFQTNYHINPDNIENILIDPTIHLVILYSSSTLHCYRVIHTEVKVPLKELVKVVNVNGDGMEYIDFVGDQTFRPLPEYYPELYDQSQCSDMAETVLGLQFIHSPAQVCLSVQSSHLRCHYSALSRVYGVLRDFSSRYGGQLTLKNTGLSMTRALYGATEEFDEKVEVWTKVKEDLAILSAQYRAIERRLLCKIKDKSSSNLTSLERLLQDTFTRIIQQIQAYTHAHNAVTSLRIEIGQIARLVGTVMNRAREDANGLIAACLNSVSQHYGQDQNWTEVCSKQIDYILKEKLELPLSRHKNTLSELFQQMFDHLSSQEIKGKSVSPILEVDGELENEDNDSMRVIKANTIESIDETEELMV
ncbi:hypothetical protein M8J75_012137 [Diaphorina citri]|nr:hypothetical protein M8J75_012137 [Diaphorina citri]